VLLARPRARLDVLLARARAARFDFGIVTEPGDAHVKTIRNTLLYLLAAAAFVPGCADEGHEPEPIDEPDEQVLGTLALPLETTAASGTRYRLRQAVFLVDRSNLSGLFGGIAGLGGLFGGVVDAGDPVVTTGGGGMVGAIGGGSAGGGSTVGGGGGDIGDDIGGDIGGDFSGGVGGDFSGGITGGGVTGAVGGLLGSTGGGDISGAPGGFISGTPGGFISGIPGASVFGFTREIAIDSEDNPLAPEIRKEIPSGSYRIFLQDGWFLERVFGNEAFEVDATLVGSATQNFSISSGVDTQIFYTFETDGQIIRFEKRGGLVITPQVIETQPDTGVEPPPDFGSVIELNRSALSSFTLAEVMGAIATNAGLPSDPTLLYQTVIDSYASAANGQLEIARHCGDETTNGEPSLNGFPLRCDRIETQQFNNLNLWFATALVSRIDLAPEDGSNCGQQRMVFANNANGRIFMILEAQIPNPHPECGVDACRPLAQAWLDLSRNDPETRGNLLREMFLTGSASLTEAGFPPFINANNMTVGSGTIRTNNFDDFPWTLREFKVVVNEDGGEVIAVPFPVAESPRGELWNDTSTHPAAEACRANFLDALEGVITDNVSRMRFVVDDACKNSESQNDFFTEDYATHLSSGSGAFAQEIEARVAGTGLTAVDVANRARFGGSCIGCHQESSGAFLGNGVFAPFSIDFPQILEFTEQCADGSFNCSGISPGLRQEFLPHRQQVHLTLLSRSGCGIDGDPFDPEAGVPDAGTRDAGEPPRDAGVLPPPTDAGPPRLPPLAPIENLVTADQAARSRLDGLMTIGGQPARTTH
jgi:hypothetical protein